MKIRLKKENKDGIIRVETGGSIKEVLVKENFLKPKEESVMVCYKGIDSSGIIELSPKEIEELYRSVKGKIGLINQSRIFS